MHRVASQTVFVVLAGALFVACGVDEPSHAARVWEEQSPSAFSTVESAIIRGQDDRGDEAVVAIIAQVAGKEGSSLCTGTLIAPRVVLTAAHCVAPATVMSDWNLADGDVPPPMQHAVKGVHWDSAFDANDVAAGHDIAVVELEEAMKVKPLGWSDQALPESLAGSTVRIVGYGLSSGLNAKGAGVKRMALTRLNRFDERLVETGGLTNARICNGDSGGPVLAVVGGVEKVIGVNSYGFALCLASGKSTRVDTYKDFVRSFLR
jgi:secreted trypsin-like serine protease